MNRLLIGLLVLIVAFRCKPADVSKPVMEKGLAGTWLLSESGFSPGSGYIINKIPPIPRQTLTFTTDGKVKAQGDGLKGYQAFTQYRVDTLNKFVRIHFMPSNPDHYDFLYVSGDTLRLSQTECIEGCHIGFIRTSDSM